MTQPTIRHHTTRPDTTPSSGVPGILGQLTFQGTVSLLPQSLPEQSRVSPTASTARSLGRKFLVAVPSFVLPSETVVHLLFDATIVAQLQGVVRASSFTSLQHSIRAVSSRAGCSPQRHSSTAQLSHSSQSDVGRRAAYGRAAKWRRCRDAIRGHSCQCW